MHQGQGCIEALCFSN